jgi:hypothetical protein
MKSIILSIAAALMLWGSSAMTSQADAQYVRYNRGYYGGSYAPRYYNRGYYAPRYYSGYRGNYRPYYNSYYYGRPYYGGYYGNSYYGGGYYRPGVSVGVGPARVGVGF